MKLFLIKNRNWMGFGVEIGSMGRSFKGGTYFRGIFNDCGAITPSEACDIAAFVVIKPILNPHWNVKL